MSKEIPLEDARYALAKIWFPGGAVTTLILAVQSMLGVYDSLQEVFAWFVPNLFPTIALMGGVLGAGALRQGADPRTVKAAFFSLSKLMSLFYLAMLLLTVLMHPIALTKNVNIFAVSNFWLGPTQAVVVAAIAVLFAAQEMPQNPAH